MEREIFKDIGIVLIYDERGLVDVSGTLDNLEEYEKYLLERVDKICAEQEELRKKGPCSMLMIDEDRLPSKEDEERFKKFETNEKSIEYLAEILSVVARNIRFEKIRRTE